MFFISSHVQPCLLTYEQLYTSDGINETYIDREISDKSGNVAITVNTVRFFLNQYMSFM